MTGSVWLNDKDVAELSPLQQERLAFKPVVPTCLRGDYELVKSPKQIEQGQAVKDALAKALPNLVRPGAACGNDVLDFKPKSASPAPTKAVRVGVVFCGRQTPGGHNIVTGLYDFLKARNTDSEVYGFLGGSQGLIRGDAQVLDATYLAKFRNQGGLDMIARTVDMVHGEAQSKAALESAKKYKLDGLVMVGGPYSNTDAGLLADYFLANGSTCSVLSVPCTIDGDLLTDASESVVGFDTATKIFSQLIGNIAIDGISARKYYFFMRLMGRQHSHITLECALGTQPNYVLIGEEIQSANKTLRQITNELADMIAARAANDQNYGVVLVPEGLVSFVPELSAMINEMNDLFANGHKGDCSEFLTPWNKALFQFLPEWFRNELMLERESHGNIQHSQIQLERLLIDLLNDELKARKAAGKYNGSFNAIPHFVGYQARGSLPSNFDCNLGSALGAAAGATAILGYTGFMMAAGSMNKAPADWDVRVIPIPSTMELAKGKSGVVEPSVQSAKVDLNGGPFTLLNAKRAEWAMQDEYRNPGPIQFGGPTADSITYSLKEHYRNI